jgi:hypothetical protein
MLASGRIRAQKNEKETSCEELRGHAKNGTKPADHLMGKNRCVPVFMIPHVMHQSSELHHEDAIPNKSFPVAVLLRPIMHTRYRYTGSSCMKRARRSSLAKDSLVSDGKSITADSESVHVIMRGIVLSHLLPNPCFLENCRSESRTCASYFPVSCRAHAFWKTSKMNNIRAGGKI